MTAKILILVVIQLAAFNIYAAEEFKPAADSNGHCVEDIAANISLIMQAVSDNKEALKSVTTVAEEMNVDKKLIAEAAPLFAAILKNYGSNFKCDIPSGSGKSVGVDGMTLARHFKILSDMKVAIEKFEASPQPEEKQ